MTVSSWGSRHWLTKAQVDLRIITGNEHAGENKTIHGTSQASEPHDIRRVTGSNYKR